MVNDEPVTAAVQQVPVDRLESRGVEIARGDMLKLDSLGAAAMNGADAVITTTAGYTRGARSGA